MNRIFFVLFFIPLILISQTRIDGVAAVIGDQIILDSDIFQFKKLYQEQGQSLEESSCQIIDQMLMDKAITYLAKQDTILQKSISSSEIDQRIDGQISYFLDRFNGDEAALLKEFNMQTMAEFQEELKDVTTNDVYKRKKTQELTMDIDISPVELKDFYEKHKYDLPDVNEEISISHIVLYPELSEEHVKEITDKLSDIKAKVENGEDFGEMASLYSEDPGSRGNGGLYEKVPRGKMVKQFDAVAFNLQEGEISDPFETEYGYHIVKVDKRRGQLLDLRHILIRSTPNDKEIKVAEKKLDSIRGLILAGEITFKEAAKEYSDDKFTKYNGGVITDPETGEDKIEKLKLTTNEFYETAGLKPGDITKAFEDDIDDRKVVRMLKVEDLIDAHKLSMDKDYSRIKNYAIQQKKQETIKKYIEDNIPNTNIIISNEYKRCPYTMDWLQEDVE